MTILGDQTKPSVPAEVFKIVRRWRCGRQREYSGIYITGWRYETIVTNVSTRQNSKLTDSERRSQQVEHGFHVFPTKAGALDFWKYYSKEHPGEDNVLAVFNADPEDFVARNLKMIYPQEIYHRLLFMRIERLPK